MVKGSGPGVVFIIQPRESRPRSHWARPLPGPAARPILRAAPVGRLDVERNPAEKAGMEYYGFIQRIVDEAGKRYGL